MAKLSLKERLLKRKGVLAKTTVTLIDLGKVELHEIKSEQRGLLKDACTRDGEVDQSRFNKMMIAAALHDEDGNLVFDESFKREYGTHDDAEIIDDILKDGEVAYLNVSLQELMGYGNFAQEEEELKN